MRRAIGLAALALAALPAVGQAASVSRDATTLHFTAERGEANRTQISPAGTDIVITDPGASRIVDRDGAGGCSVAGGVATCPSGGLTDAEINLRDRADSTSAVGNLASLVPFTYDLGSGNDRLQGTNGGDVVVGGQGSDFVDGNQGNDFVLAGDGNDSMQWDPGDASDTLEGQAGQDELVFNGSNIAERFDVFPNGGRVLLTRDIATVTMDLDDVETIDLHAFGGDDTTTVNDMSGTDLKTLNEDLGAFGGGGDGGIDNVAVNGTDGPDHPAASKVGGGATISGFAVRTTVRGAEPANDRITVNTLAGADDPKARPGAASAIAVRVDGGADIDTFHSPGTSRADGFQVIANGSFVFTSADGGASGVDSSTEELSVEGHRGDDTMTGTGNLAALTSLIVDAGGGNDAIRGGNGTDLLIGGDGKDFVDGNQGNDTVLAGAGDDSMQWDPGDGSDVLEGQGDRDKLAFNGSNIAERFDVFPNGGRVFLTRDIATVTMDLNDVEEIDHHSFGGADTITVNDMSGTDLTDFKADLAAFGGGGDAAADNVVVNGSAGVDQPIVRSVAGGVRVDGLATRTTVTGAEPGSDNLTVNTLGGNDQPRTNPDVAGPIGILIDGGADADTFHALGSRGADTFATVANGTLVFISGDPGGTTGLNTNTENLKVEALAGADSFSAIGNLVALTRITVDSGSGGDTLRGGNGPDTFIAGDGNDFIDGNQGDDLALAGAGKDSMQWDPGDGNDTLEGQSERDTLTFNGSNGDERTEVSANGGRVRVTRDLASITMDLDDVEEIIHNSLGGADVTTINDMSGTDLTDFRENLSGSFGTPSADGAPDEVIVNGTPGVDGIDISGSASTGVDVAGLATSVAIRNQEQFNDRLTVHTLAGDDSVDTSALAPNSIDLVVD